MSFETARSVGQPSGAVVDLAIHIARVGAPASDALLAVLVHAGHQVHADFTPFVASTAPDVVLLIDAENGGDIITTIAETVAEHPSARIVLMSRIHTGPMFMLAMQAGAAGFIELDARPEAVERTIRAVVDFGIAIPRSLVPYVVTKAQHGGTLMTNVEGLEVELSDREWEVLSQLRLGHTTAEIAAELFICKATVRSHIAAVEHKLGVQDRKAAIALIDPH